MTHWKNQPGTIRCSDCALSPGRSGHTCQTTGRLIFKLGAWRRCKAFEERPGPQLSLANVWSSGQQYNLPLWRRIRTDFDDLWVGTEPLFSYLGSSPEDEAEVAKAVIDWLKWRRAEYFRWFEVAKRRAEMKVVD